MVSLGYVINYVTNVEESIRFFENVCGYKRRFIDESGDYGEVDAGGSVVLSFATHQLGKHNLPNGYISMSDSKKPLGIELALVTEHVNELHKKSLEYGAIELSAPEVKPWGQTVSYVQAPFGLLLELCSPI